MRAAPQRSRPRAIIRAGAAAGLTALAAAWTPAQEAQERLPTSAEVTAKVKYPLLRVPYMKTAPTIDGRLDPREWEDAGCYVAFWQDYGHNMFFHLAIEEKQPQFYIAYDKEHLYMAHRSPVFPKGAWLKCRGKYKDVDGHPEYGVLNDDHTEFEIMPTASTEPRMGWFKWMSNPIDTPIDFFTGPVPMVKGYDVGWDSGYALKGIWNDDWWVTEMRIPLRSLQHGMYDGKDAKGNPLVPVPIPDGTIWRHWGARAIGGTGGFYRLFSATTPGGWECNSMRLIFDSRGVSAQVETIGQVMLDQVDLHIQLKNHGARSETCRVGFYIENDTELIVANEDEAFVELLPGEVKDIRIKKDKIGVTPKGDALWLDIRTLSGMPVYRSILSTFHHMDGVPGFRAHFVDGMKFSREARKPFEYTFAYYASTNKLRAVIDTDVFGVSDEIKTAVEARVKLVEENGNEVRTMAIPLEVPLAHPDARTFGGKRGENVMSFPKLKPGKYKTICLLYDANKKILADQESKTFEQTSYPWEGSTEGLDDIVWDPYVPIVWEAARKTVGTLMHEITLGACGLPEQIAIKGKRPNWGPQLRAPLRLEASVKTRRFPYQPGGELKRTLERQSEIVFETSGKVGPVATRSRVQYDCDGFMMYDLDYQTGKDAIDTLELVLDLAPLPVDLFGVQIGTKAELHSDILGSKDPVVWNSRTGTKPRELFYGNFTPCAFIGNGDRMLIWSCDTDRGMKLLAEKPAMQLEKNEAGEYTLRIFFVNEPGPVEEARHVRFYLTTLPTKPHSRNHRTLNWKYEGLGGGPPVSEGKPESYSIHLGRDEDYAKFQPKPIVERPYTTMNMVSFDMPGLRELCYTGEWLGRTDASPNPTLHGEGRHPVTGRAYDNIFISSHTGYRMCPSMVDSAVYWRSKQIRLGGVQGWWWDHYLYGELDVDPVIGQAYFLPKHKAHPGGYKQCAFHYYLPRMFFKRVLRVIARAGREEGSFTQGIVSKSAHYGGIQSALAEFFLRDEVNWEGAASYTGGYPHMQYWPLDFMRLCAGNYGGLNGYFIHDVHYGDHPQVAGIDPILDRSILGSALLHDLGSELGRHANQYTHRNVLKALEEFGYFEDEETTEFIPYWRSRPLWKYGLAAEEDERDAFADAEEKERVALLKNVFCTIYRNRKTHKALVVLANYAGKSVQENLYVSNDLLGKAPQKCTDVEVGEPIPFQEDVKRSALGTGTPRQYVPNTFAPIFVDRYQFRMLVVE